MDLSRKVVPYDPQMARDAMAHYDAMYCDLIEMAEEMEEQADGFRERATEAKLRAENLRDRLVEDGHPCISNPSETGSDLQRYDGEA